MNVSYGAINLFRDLLSAILFRDVMRMGIDCAHVECGESVAKQATWPFS